jgi:membrane protein DedA with SNARE-associated domain
MSQLELKGYLRALKPQLVTIGIVLILQILSLLSIIPTPNQILLSINNLLATHGIPLIIIASFIESLAVLGAYFPGSIAILSVMAMTAGNPARAILTYFAIILPAAAANILSYFIGYFNRDKGSLASARSNKKLLAWYAATYWHPKLASVTAMASGGEGVKFSRYLSYCLPISIIWSVFWALVLYKVGSVIANPSFFTPIFYCYLIGWLLWGVRKHYGEIVPI